MEDAKVPLALVAAMTVQLAGGVWWVSQQASTIASLEETVSELGSRMAIENNIHLRRDVQLNAEHIEDFGKKMSSDLSYVWTEIEDLWTEIDGLAATITAINGIKQRLALLENELKYINRDHNGMMDKKGDMD